MIRAVFSGTTLTLQGHAGSAPYGQDLVCAAVSALAYALAQRLTELDHQGAFEEPPRIELSSGNGQISVIAKAKCAREIEEDFRLIYSGLMLLQNHYPQCITVDE